MCNKLAQIVSLNEELEFYAGVRPFLGAKLPKFKVLNSKNSLFIRKQAPPKKKLEWGIEKERLYYILLVKVKMYWYFCDLMHDY